MFYKPPIKKRRWSSFADIPFGDEVLGADILYTPPSGWEVLSGPSTITPGNQSDYGAPLWGCDQLKSVAILIPSTQSGELYAPPLGWWVVEIRNAQLDEQQVVWISPEGKAVLVQACSNQTTGDTGTAVIPRPQPDLLPASIPWWLLVGAAAVGVYLLWKK